jgi:AcrR family transcriptional regulator
MEKASQIMAEQITSDGEDRASTRDLILDAAERVVARDGARRLTIDAVVKESGYSKGGVLYNFPSKLDLIKGMAARMIDAFEVKHATAIAEADAAGKPPLPAVVKALVGEKEMDNSVSMGCSPRGGKPGTDRPDPRRPCAHARRFAGPRRGP